MGRYTTESFPKEIRMILKELFELFKAKQGLSNSYNGVFIFLFYFILF